MAHGVVISLVGTTEVRSSLGLSELWLCCAGRKDGSRAEKDYLPERPFLLSRHVKLRFLQGAHFWYISRTARLPKGDFPTPEKTLAAFMRVYRGSWGFGKNWQIRRRDVGHGLSIRISRLAVVLLSSCLQPIQLSPIIRCVAIAGLTIVNPETGEEDGTS